MKRMLMITVMVCIIAGSANSANLVDIYVPMIADSLRVGFSTTLDIYIENDFKLGGMSLGFQIWSPDGASWNWEDVGGFGAHGYVTSILTSRLGDGSVFDMTGILVTEQSIDELGRDSIMVGGVAMMRGLPTGPLEHMLSYHFTPRLQPMEESGTLCFDSCFVPPSGAFVFVDNGGSAGAPMTLWPAGGLCLPVRPFPQCCPEWNPGLPVSMDVNHCGSGSVVLSASDCEMDEISFQLGSLTGGGGTASVIDNGNGTCEVIYNAVPSDIGATISISIQMSDMYHLWGDCIPFTLNVNVTNNAPGVTCGAFYNAVCSGNTIQKDDITASDMDACDNLTFSMISGPGNIDPVTGEYTWASTPVDVGTHTVCVAATDGYDVSESCFELDVLGCEWFEIQIEKVHEALQGHYVDVALSQNKGTDPMGGFDFLIGYDASSLAFSEAILSEWLVDCGWEYFTYRYSWNGNCGTACPTGLVRLIGIAETDNGPNHPDYGCIGETPSAEGEIATLTFFVSNDRTLECMYLPIQFYWIDCNDNSISSVTGDTLFVSRHVYDFEGTDITDPTFGFPTYYGMVDDPCMEGDKVVPIRYVDFINGGIDVICADSIDARGDINVNGVANEIADAVMFTNYFISGLSAFGNHIEASIAASDVNADGIALSVADLVYLVRVIVGDANPYPKPLPETPVTIMARGGMVTYDSPANIGAALLTFHVSGESGQPQPGLGAAAMDIKYSRNGDELRVLIYNIGSEMIPAGQNDLVTIPGQVELTGAEMATYDGYGIEALIRNLPQHFDVGNFPNPFNPATTISLSLPEASAWSVKIFNVAGQLVSEYTGNAGAGTVEVTWDGTDNSGSRVASGIYLYKAEAGAYTATRKMILTK